MKVISDFSDDMIYRLDQDLLTTLRKYGIDQKFDDSNRLRAYLVISDLTSRNRQFGWLDGFLFCVSFWLLWANAIPFSWTSELFNNFGFSRDLTIVCNLVLLTAFWAGSYFVVIGYREKEKPLWRLTEGELSELLGLIVQHKKRAKERM